MGVRNCRDIGQNLQTIVKRLMANDDLVRLLYCTDKDPLSQPVLTQEEKEQKIYNKLIKVVPRLDPNDIATSMIAVLCNKASQLDSNSEFKNVIIRVEVFVPITQWFIKDTNLRPYSILGEVQESLNGKKINGLGKLSGGDFDFNFVTDEMTSFVQIFQLTSYD